MVHWPYIKRRKRENDKDTISCEILTLTLFSIASFVIASLPLFTFDVFILESLHYYSYT